MSKGHGGISALGGWLYADLMLILFIGILSQVALPPKKVVDVEPTLTPTPTATPTPTVTPTIRPTVLARVGRESETVSLRTTPSSNGDVQGELRQDSFVYVLDETGDWANVVITTFIRADLLRAPSDALFGTPLPPKPSPTRVVPTPTRIKERSLSSDKVDKVMIVVPSNLTTSSSLEQRVAFRKYVLTQIRQKLAKEKRDGSRIGMVLTFGGAPAGQPGIGGALASRVNQLMKQNLVDTGLLTTSEVENPFEDTAFESFHDFTVPLDTVELWIYVYVN